jgi:hypothetical protein
VRACMEHGVCIKASMNFSTVLCGLVNQESCISNIPCSLRSPHPRLNPQLLAPRTPPQPAQPLLPLLPLLPPPQPHPPEPLAPCAECSTATPALTRTRKAGTNSTRNEGHHLIRIKDDELVAARAAMTLEARFESNAHRAMP